MREDVTEEEVHAAMDELVAEGKKVTCRAVLEKTGGSMSTVISGMRTYQPPQTPRTDVASQESDEAAREIAEIVSRVAAGSRAPVEVRLVEAKSQVSELLTQCETVQAERDRSVAENEDLKARCEALSTRVDSEIAEKTKLREELERGRQIEERHLLEIAQARSEAEMQGKESSQLREELKEERKAGEQARITLAKTQSELEIQASRLAEKVDENKHLRALNDAETKARTEAEKMAEVSVAKKDASLELLQAVRHDVALLTAEIEREREITEREKERAEAFQLAAKEAAAEASTLRIQLTAFAGRNTPTAGRNLNSEEVPEEVGGDAPDLSDEAPETFSGPANRRKRRH